MKFFASALVLVQILVGVAHAEAGKTITKADLRSIQKLTPLKFAEYFRDFEFKFHEEIQDHDVFLRTKSGDCDDYATLAAEILGANGYTPRMIAVRMKGETHVICYIKEMGGYLDYNTRKEQNPIVPCSPEIKQIAAKVAQSFNRDWIATYEFTFSVSENVKRLVNNIIPNRSATREAKVLSNADARNGAKKNGGSPKQQP